MSFRDNLEGLLLMGALVDTTRISTLVAATVVHEMSTLVDLMMVHYSDAEEMFTGALDKPYTKQLHAQLEEWLSSKPIVYHLSPLVGDWDCMLETALGPLMLVGIEDKTILLSIGCVYKIIHTGETYGVDC